MKRIILSCLVVAALALSAVPAFADHNRRSYRYSNDCGYPYANSRVYVAPPPVVVTRAPVFPFAAPRFGVFAAPIHGGVHVAPGGFIHSRGRIGVHRPGIHFRIGF